MDNTSELFNADKNKIANDIFNLKSKLEFSSFFELSHEVSYVSIFIITLDILLKKISNNNFIKIDPLRYTQSEDNKLNFSKIYGKEYYKILHHVKNCLELIKNYKKDILKTNEEIANEIHDDIRKNNRTLNTIPISYEIIQNIIKENNTDITKKIKNKFFIVINIIFNNIDCNITKNNIKFMGLDFDENNHWLVCKINDEEIIDEYFVVGLNKNMRTKKN